MKLWRQRLLLAGEIAHLGRSGGMSDWLRREGFDLKGTFQIDRSTEDWIIRQELKPVADDEVAEKQRRHRLIDEAVDDSTRFRGEPKDPSLAYRFADSKQKAKWSNYFHGHHIEFYPCGKTLTRSRKGLVLNRMRESSVRVYERTQLEHARSYSVTGRSRYEAMRDTRRFDGAMVAAAINLGVLVID